MDKDPKSPNNDVEMNDDNDFEMENEQTLFPNLEDLPSRSNFEAYLSAVGGGSNSKNKRDMMEADDDDGDSKIRRVPNRSLEVNHLSNIFRSFTSATLMDKETEKKIQENLNSNDQGKQFDGAFELCNFLSMFTAETSGNFRYREFVPPLVKILKNESNFDLVLLSVRCLTYLVDAIPQAASAVLSENAIPLLTSKLLNVEFIDLMEQTIQCLYEISQHTSGDLLRAGVLVASFTYIDFFALNVQRTVLKMAANICKYAYDSGTFVFVEPVVPNLCDYVVCADPVLVENATKAVNKILTNYSSDEKKILVVGTEAFLGKALKSLEENPGRVMLIILLTNLCKASVTIAKQVQKGLNPTLQVIMSPENSSGLKSVQVEVTLLLLELIPKMNPSQGFPTELGVTRLKDLFQQSVSPAIPDDIPVKQRLTSVLETAALKSREELISQSDGFPLFASLVIQSLIELFSSSLNVMAKSNCLTIIGTILFYSNSDLLSGILKDIPISSFLGRLLASNDLIYVATAIRYAEILMEKLPDIFQVYFEKEGVSKEMKKLSGLKRIDKEPLLIDQLIARSKEEYENSFKEFRLNVEVQKQKQTHNENFCDFTSNAGNDSNSTGSSSSSSSSFVGGNGSKNTSANYNNVGKNSIDTELSSGRKKFDKNLSDLKERFRESRNFFISKKADIMEKDQATSSSFTNTMYFTRPHIDMPPLPSTSRLYDKEGLKNFELAEFCVAKSQNFHSKYLQATDSESLVAKRLKELSDELKDISSDNEEEQEEGLLNIAKTLCSDEGISTFELTGSGVLEQLLTFLTKHSSSPFVSSRRLEIFFKVFDMEIKTSHQLSKDDSSSFSPFRKYQFSPQKSVSQTVGSSSSTGGQIGSFKGRSSGGVDGSGGVVGRVSKGNSPSLSSPSSSFSNRSPIFMRVQYQNTYLNELIAKLESVLTSQEDITLITNDLFQSGISSIFGLIEKKIEIKLLPVEDATTAATTTIDSSSSNNNNNNNSKRNSRSPKKKIDSDDKSLTISAMPLIDVSDLSDYLEEVTFGVRKNHITNILGGFSLEEDYDEDDSNIKTVIDMNHKPVDPNDKYGFLKKESYFIRKSSDECPYSFFLNGKELDPNTSLFAALFKFGRKFNNNNKNKNSQHPALQDMSWLWEEVFVVTYKKKNQSNFTSSFPHPNSRNYLEVLGNEMNLDKITYISLELLRVLWNSCYAPQFISSSLPPRKLFQNEKISSKLLKQLQDSFLIFTKCVPLWCSFLMKHYNFLFSFETKKFYSNLTFLGIPRGIQLLQEKLNAKELQERRIKKAKIDKKKVLIDRDHLFEESFFIFEKYGGCNEYLEFQYQNDLGFGAGPTREFYTLLSSHLQKSDLGCFLNEDEKSEYVVAPFGLYPKPFISSTSAEKEGRNIVENIFYFIGLFVARSFFDNRLIDLEFSRSFLKLILGKPLDIENIDAIDKNLFHSLKKLISVLKEKQSIRQNKLLTERQKALQISQLKLDGASIADLCLDFTFPGYGNIELIPNGRNVEVTFDNLEEYINQMKNALIGNGVSLQVEAFQRGFSSIINMDYLTCFTEEELENMLNGEKEVWDVTLLTKATKCEYGYNENSMVVGYLFEVLSEMDHRTQRLFLQFATGSPKLPIGGLAKLKPKLTIVRRVCEDKEQNPNDVLPTVMTCTHYLKLPEYTSKAILKQQLLKAITLGQGAFLLS